MKLSRIAFGVWFAASLSAQEPLYERAMDRVLADAQTKLQESLKLREDRTWKNPWVVESKYFAVRAARSRAFAASFGKSMDQMVPLITALVKPDMKWPAQKPQIWVVPSVTEYNKIGESGSDQHSSIYSSHYSGTAGRPVVVLYSPSDIFLKVWATHSVVHQILATAYPRTRALPWVQEGLCSYFSLYWSWDLAKDNLARYRSGKRLTPIRTLLSRNVSTYGQNAGQNFIELGMFFNYLLHYRPDTKSPGTHDGPFAKYLQKVLANENVADDPVHLLLFRKTGTVEKEFRAQKF